MKNTILITLAIFFLFQSQMTSRDLINPKDDTISCLLIKGKIKNAHLNPQNSCKIELLTTAGLIDSVILKKGQQSFKFVLAKNSYYAIRVSKAGFVPKLVSIDTKLPEEIIDLLAFEFNTELLSLEEAKQVNKDALDFPIAIIHFNAQTEMFNYNEEYTYNIKKEIYAQDERKMLVTAQRN